jgi:hypothetical protein
MLCDGFQAMQINLIYDSSTSSAPAGFFTAMAAAAQYLEWHVSFVPVRADVDG